MKTLISLCFCFSLIGLLEGCATHYYRLDNKAEATRFYLRQPEARAVDLFTSLDGFRPRAAVLRKGRWVNTLPVSGDFTYFYRVDGTVFIPDCRYKEQDDFGQENCIFISGQ